MMKRTRECGTYYEDIASRYLQTQGLILIAKNYLSKHGEIDLIMQDRLCIAFIEVRYRKSKLFGDAQSTVNYNKQQRIIHTAYDWMDVNQLNNEELEYRFDIFAINDQHHQWIQNAFSYVAI